MHFVPPRNHRLGGLAEQRHSLHYLLFTSGPPELVARKRLHGFRRLRKLEDALAPVFAKSIQNVHAKRLHLPWNADGIWANPHRETFGH